MIRSQLRSRTLPATLAAAATLLCVAPSAFAQDPGQPPPATSVPPPMQAMSAPKGSDDMTGSLGFGVGVAAGTSLIIPGGTVSLKYWLSDVLSVVPALSFNIIKPAAPGSSTTWNFSPSAIVLFVPFRSTSTRFSVGGGLGIDLGKTPTVAVPNPDTRVGIFIPVQAGLEHFFTRWFSMGIAAQFHLIDYRKDDRFSISIDTTQLLGSLFFYTD